MEVFRCEKRQFVKNLREHWSDDERITVKGLKDCAANSVIAEEERGGKSQSVCLCALDSIIFLDGQVENN